MQSESSGDAQLGPWTSRQNICERGHVRDDLAIVEVTESVHECSRMGGLPLTKAAMHTVLMNVQPTVHRGQY